MKYEAEIDGRQIEIDIEERDGHIRAIIEQRSYDLELIRPESSVYLLFSGDHVYETRVWPSDAGTLRIKLRDRIFTARIIDRKHRRSPADQGNDGEQHLISPMPGKVVRILLNTGDQVTTGQGVIIVEAMKMQNEIKSPKDGRVSEIRVREGVTVNANQVLAVVE